MRNKGFIHICTRMTLGIYLLAVWGVMVGVIHLNMLFLLFFISFFTMNRMEMAISVLLIFPPLLGTIFQIMGIFIPGTIVALLIALCLIRFKIIKIVIKNRVALFYCVIIVFIFVCYYFFTGRTEYSQEKIKELCITSVLYFISASAIVSSPKIDLCKVGKLFLIYALSLIVISIEFIGYEPIGGIFDFSTFRETARIFQYTMDVFFISYHSVGIAGMTGLALFLSNDKKMGIMDCLVVVAFLWLILLSGARQALVGAFIIILFRYVIVHRRINILDICKIVCLCLCGVTILFLLDIEFINKIFENSSSIEDSLNRNYDYPFKLMSNNFFDGIGFGNYYNNIGQEYYPHNIILELMCEFGLMGTLLFLSIVIFFCIRNKVYLRKQILCGSFVAIIYIPFLVRSVISDSLGHNVSVFILLFVLFYKTTPIFSNIVVSDK